MKHPVDNLEKALTVAGRPRAAHRGAPALERELQVQRDAAEALRRQSAIDRRIAAVALEQREAERRQLSRELHEELGQRLSALKMDVAGLQAVATPAAQAVRVAEMLASIDEAVAAVRRIVAELRPPMLDDLGLNAALEWLARQAAEGTGFAIRLHLDEGAPPLDEPSRVAVYRTVQDALRRIAGAGRARQIDVWLRHCEGELMLTICAEGCRWCDAAPANDADGAAAACLGAQALLLGARWRFDRLPGGGQSMTMRLPLKPA